MVLGATGTLDRQRDWAPMLDLLYAAANNGTGRRAALCGADLRQDRHHAGQSRRIVHRLRRRSGGRRVGRARRQRSLGKVSGGTVPATIWRNFMTSALAIDGSPRARSAGRIRAPARRVAPPKPCKARCRPNGATPPSSCATWPNSSSEMLDEQIGGGKKRAARSSQAALPLSTRISAYLTPIGSLKLSGSPITVPPLRGVPEQQQAGEMRRRHRGSADGVVAAIEPGRFDRHAGLGKIDRRGAIVREARPIVADREGRNGIDVRAIGARRRMVVGIVALIARGKREVDPARSRGDTASSSAWLTPPPRLMLATSPAWPAWGDIIDPGDDARSRAAAAAVEHSNRDDPGARRDADHADRIVMSGNGAGDVGAVTILVGRRRIAAKEGCGCATCRR